MDNLCNICNTTVIPTTNSFLTTYNLCQKNICLKCTDITFLSSNTNDGITWTCLSCRSENRENIDRFFEDITEKLSSIESSLSNLAGTSAVANSKPPSFSEIVQSSPSMHTIKISEDNKEKNYRQLNHIIHGVSKLINGDEFVKELFSIHLKTDIKPSSIKRIGSPGINNYNLIRIRYTSDTDKAQISSSLKFLKTAPSKFKKIRTADDLAFEDQTKLRKLRNEATELNKANEDSTLKHVVHYNRIPVNNCFENIVLKTCIYLYI